MDTISHPELDLIDNPDFWCRGMQLSCSFSLNDDPDKKELIRKKIDWMAKNGFSWLLVPFGDLWDNTKDFILEEINKRGIKLEMGHHYFGKIAPGSLYLQERPDLFPLQDNKRQPAGQLGYCLGNEDFIELASRKVIQEITDNPAIAIFDFWPDDFGAKLCECENCVQIDDPEDTEATDWNNLSHLRADRGIERRGDRRKMRRYLHLANQVAGRVAAVYPKVKISVLAYLDLVDPPASKMVVHPNIIINLAMAWSCSVHTINDPGCYINSQFYDTLKQWTKVVNPKNIVIYGYYQGLFGWYSLPYPIVKNLFQEWDLFKSLGMGGVQIQSLIKQMGVYGLNYAAISRLLREDHSSFTEFLEAYCKGFFGPAAGPMAQLFLEMEECLRRDKKKHVCPKPCLYIDNAFSRESTRKCREYIDQALSLTEDGLYRRRIERIRSLENYIDLWLDLPLRGKMLSNEEFTAKEENALNLWLDKLDLFCREHLTMDDDMFLLNCADHIRQVLEKRVKIL